MNPKTPPDGLRIEMIARGHPALGAFLHALPVDSGWPVDTVLSLTDREPTEFERAENYVAAFEDEQIVGAISLHPAAPGNYHRMHNLHFHIDILAPWQGKGIGTALMSRLIEHAREQGYWRIYLGTLSWNTRALGLFGRFGFRVEGVSRAAYRVKTEGGKEYFLDGIGMALWIGPQLVMEAGDWKLHVGERPAPVDDGILFNADDSAGIEELVSLYASVNDHRHRYSDMLKGAWQYSDLSVTARKSGELVGLARGITDRHTTLFVCDCLVRPEFQRRGIGGELMRRLIAPYRGIYQVVLLTDPETLSFYRKLGYMHWESACLKMHAPGDADDAPEGDPAPDETNEK